MSVETVPSLFSDGLVLASLLTNTALWTGLALLLAVLWAVMIVSKYVRLMLNIIRDVPPAFLLGPFDFEHVEGRTVSFRAFDGTRLEGMFLSSDDLQRHRSNAPCEEVSLNCGPRGRSWFSSGARGLVVFCHEFGSDRYSAVRYCRGLLEAGYDVFTFDFRHTGRSSRTPGYEPGLWCTEKEVADCLGALLMVQACIEASGRTLPIGLMGVSRGAAVAINTSFRAGAMDVPIDAVMVDGAFSTDMLMERFMKRWAHIFARMRFMHEHHPQWWWRFLRWLLLRAARKRFHCEFPLMRKSLERLETLPLFFVHGEKDSYLPFEQTRRLYELAGPPRYLWVVPGAKHNQAVAVDPERYHQRSVAFFSRFLSGASVQPETTGLPTAVAPPSSAIGPGKTMEGSEASAFFDGHEYASVPLTAAGR